MGEHLADLAQAEGQPLAMVGGPGAGLTDAATGEYAHHSDACLDSLEFMKSLVEDELILRHARSTPARPGPAGLSARVRSSLTDRGTRA